MRGWAELLLCGAVLAACWTRTPVGALGENAIAWIRGRPMTADLLASFRTDLPQSLEDALVVALQAEPGPLPRLPDVPGGPAWSPALRTAITASLGEPAASEILALDPADPEAALETWAIGPELRQRAIDRARAAGARDPERLAQHAPYLPEKDARAAKKAVQDTLSLATVLDLAWPVDPSARVSSGFGYRQHPVLGTKRLHEGVDIAVPIGTPVHAAGPGKVSRSRSDDVNGQHVVLDHGHRVSTAYCHGSALHVEKGQQVEQGVLIMDSGNSGRSTGPHLHFGLRIGGRPLDPAPFQARAARKDAT